MSIEFIVNISHKERILVWNNELNLTRRQHHG